VPTRQPKVQLTALIYYQELSKAQNALLKCIISVSSTTQSLTTTRDYVPEKVTIGKTKVNNTQTLCGLETRVAVMAIMKTMNPSENSVVRLQSICNK
jgi:hypothetical protein